MSTAVIDRPVDVDGPPDHHAHAVREDVAAVAIATRTTVRALCGIMWVPSRDAAPGDPLCPSCTRLLERLTREAATSG